MRVAPVTISRPDKDGNLVVVEVIENPSTIFTGTLSAASQKSKAKLYQITHSEGGERVFLADAVGRRAAIGLSQIWREKRPELIDIQYHKLENDDASDVE